MMYLVYVYTHLRWTHSVSVRVAYMYIYIYVYRYGSYTVLLLATQRDFKGEREYTSDKKRERESLCLEIGDSHEWITTGALGVYIYRLCKDTYYR